MRTVDVPRRRFAIEAGAAAFLVLLHLVLYRKIFRLWWVYDDSNLLLTMFNNAFSKVWLSHDVWPQQLFTPLMYTAFKALWALFGIDPLRWWAMHLALACVTAISLYAAARRFLDVGPSLAGATIFAVGVPLCSLVTQLSTIHYFIALTFCSFATIAWVASMQRQRIAFALLSALLYFAALLAKEIAAPLPLLLVFLPAGDVRTRWRRIPAHAFALIVYLLWRRMVIGTALGAYSWVIDRNELPAVLLHLPWKLLRAAAGRNLPLGLLLIAAMGIVIATALRRRNRIYLMLAALAAAIGPILLVAKDIHPRYTVALWLVWAFAFAAAAGALANGRLRVALLIVIPLLAIVVNRQEWGREFTIRQQMSDEARFFFDIEPGGMLRRPATPPPVMREWYGIKAKLGKPAGAICFYDDYYLCANDVTGRRVWEYDTSKRMLVEISPDIPRIAQQHCSSIRTTAPLSATFDINGDELHWDLGPYDQGRYSALLGEGLEAWELPRRSALNLHGAFQLALRVRYDSPEGWTTYSPVFALDFAKQTDVAWRR